ncbi:MAG: Hsp33 family molecular chaperone HslO [Oscillospiraceae bacterium]
MGEIVRAVSADGAVKISAVEARDIAERARQIHKTSPTATAALGRSLCATSMLGDMLKENGASLTVRINGGGAIGTIMTVSDNGGNVRGYAQNPEADLPTRPDGKLDVGGIVGKDGMITVSRDLGFGEPYVGSAALISGEIAEDFTEYYSESEQVPSACGLGVLVDTDHSVKAAGGFIVQLMPGAADGTIGRLEANIAALRPVSSILDGGGIDAIISGVLAGMEPETLERHPIEYRCYCSRERVRDAVASIGLEALEEIAKDKNPTRVSCQFCDVEYVFTPEEIALLVVKAKKEK